MMKTCLLSPRPHVLYSWIIVLGGLAPLPAPLELQGIGKRGQPFRRREIQIRLARPVVVADLNRGEELQLRCAREGHRKGARGGR